jgi:hypothetical protein
MAHVCHRGRRHHGRATRGSAGGDRAFPHDFRSIHPQDARIFLLEGAPRVLPSYPEDLSDKAKAALIKLSVTLRADVFVTEIDDGGVTAPPPVTSECPAVSSRANDRETGQHL